MLPPEIASIVKLAGKKTRQHYVFPSWDQLEKFPGPDEWQRQELKEIGAYLRNANKC